MLKVYRLNQSDEWDSTVRKFEKYDVYYLSGYVRAFEIHGDGEPMLLYYENDDICGINVVMKRDIANDDRFAGIIKKDEYYDLSTPYGYGGWHFEGTQSDYSGEKFEEEYQEWCRNNKIVSEFVRFHPVLNNVDEMNNGIYERINLGKTVAIELDSEEAIWERYSSKNRGHIRVATREGVVVKIDSSKEAFDIFKSIYETTMDHDDANSYYYFDDRFFDSIRNDLYDCCSLFTAYLDETPIASSIMLYAGGLMNYHLSGQLFEYRRYSGTSMILNEAAKWGCEQGFEWLHLGGGLGAKEGPLYDFKKSFYKKGKDKEFYIGRMVFDQEKYNQLVEMRKEELSEGFFPLYRA